MWDKIIQFDSFQCDEQQIRRRIRAKNVFFRFCSLWCYESYYNKLISYIVSFSWDQKYRWSYLLLSPDSEEENIVTILTLYNQVSQIEFDQKFYTTTRSQIRNGQQA